MVGRQGPIARRQGRPATVRQLIRMQPDRQPQGGGLIEQARDFIRVKGDGLAIGIHRIHQALGMGGGQDIIHSLIHIGRAIVPVLGRQGMKPQIAGADPHPGIATNPARNAQHLQLTVAIQAIAGLDLDRGDAGLLQARQPLDGQVVKLVLACLAGGADRGDDAAARAGDVFIADARQPLLELARAVAAKDQVGVAIDQARRDPSPFQSLDLFSLVFWQIGTWADPCDATILDQDSAVLDGSIGHAGLGHGGDPAVNQQAIRDQAHRLRLLAGEKRATSS